MFQGFNGQRVVCTIQSIEILHIKHDFEGNMAVYGLASPI